MTMPGVADFITSYAKLVAAPVKSGTTVTSVSRRDDEYRVTTDQGEWRCDTVVIATGAFNVPYVPLCAEAVPRSECQGVTGGFHNLRSATYFFRPVSP